MQCKGEMHAKIQENGDMEEKYAQKLFSLSRA